MAGLVLVAVTVLACSAGGSVIVEDPVELQYRQVWRDGVGALAERVKPFYAGICNVGGDQQQCHRASADQAAAIEDFLNRLNEIEVPPKFAEGHAAIRAALEQWRDGLLQRNRGFELQSNEDFREGNEKIGRSRDAIVAAYERFPEGDRPEPAILG